jgi:hypothetical protein
VCEEIGDAGEVTRINPFRVAVQEVLDLAARATHLPDTPPESVSMMTQARSRHPSTARRLVQRSILVFVFFAPTNLGRTTASNSGSNPETQHPRNHAQEQLA